MASLGISASPVVSLAQLDDVTFGAKVERSLRHASMSSNCARAHVHVDGVEVVDLSRLSP